MTQETIFMIETRSIVCEVRAQAEETVECKALAHCNTKCWRFPIGESKDKRTTDERNLYVGRECYGSASYNGHVDCSSSSSSSGGGNNKVEVLITDGYFRVTYDVRMNPYQWIYQKPSPCNAVQFIYSSLYYVLRCVL